jgi:hypothetical protein
MKSIVIGSQWRSLDGVRTGKSVPAIGGDGGAHTFVIRESKVAHEFQTAPSPPIDTRSIGRLARVGRAARCSYPLQAVSAFGRCSLGQPTVAAKPQQCAGLFASAVCEPRICSPASEAKERGSILKDPASRGSRRPGKRPPHHGRTWRRLCSRSRMPPRDVPVETPCGGHKQCGL